MLTDLQQNEATIFTNTETRSFLTAYYPINCGTQIFFLFGGSIQEHSLDKYKTEETKILDANTNSPEKCVQISSTDTSSYKNIHYIVK